MARGCVIAGLAVATLALCGCSNAVQRLDLGEWHNYMAQDPYTGENAPGHVKGSSPIRAAVARDLIKRAQREEAAFARSEFLPWSRVETKEQVEAEDAPLNARLKEANRNVCRLC